MIDYISMGWPDVITAATAAAIPKTFETIFLTVLEHSSTVSVHNAEQSVLVIGHEAQHTGPFPWYPDLHGG